MRPSSMRAAAGRTIARQKWIWRGGTLPPPHGVKQQAVLSFRRRFRLNVLVETGTYLGEMIDAVKGSFESIRSIELDETLHRKAADRFSSDRHVTLLQGDSGERLKDVLRELDRPALFWLDGHYSGGNTARGETETPIIQELGLVFGHPLARSHVILIDDARLFTGQGDYPDIPRLRALAAEAGMTSFDVKDDIIRIHARQ
jgi:hypothetical protein